MTDPLRLRQAARAIVTDRRGRLLLVHFDFDGPEMPDGLWACPGGGLEPGETAATGVVRELHEELGLDVSDVGAPVWSGTRLFPMTGWDGQHDTYFWVQVDDFEPHPHFTDQQLRAEHLDAMRWWTPEELSAAGRAYDAGHRVDGSYVVFAPRRLAGLLADLVEGGHPAEPVDVTDGPS
ncbi:MAG: NUDIX hydrolase [Nocardioidaceae bacterium]